MSPSILVSKPTSICIRHPLRQIGVMTKVSSSRSLLSIPPDWNGKLDPWKMLTPVFAKHAQLIRQPTECDPVKISLVLIGLIHAEFRESGLEDIAESMTLVNLSNYRIFLSDDNMRLIVDHSPDLQTSISIYVRSIDVNDLRY
jgi:hypothetical protein